LIKARISASYPKESDGEYEIHPRTSEKWTRLRPEVVRIFAYNLWHDFKLSPGAVVILNSNLFLEILNNKTRFRWNARVSGPRI